jgi:hypothetical protein
MCVANLLVLVALGLGDRPDAAGLVDQLGSGRYAQREAAAAALEKLGGEALPALREALASRDPEVRSRAAVLIEKIDSELLTRPTLIKLDFNDVTLSEIAQKLSAESGVSILLEPVNHPMWKNRKLNLQEPVPVSFWKAIDLLSQAGGLVPNPAAQMGDMGRSPVLRLYSGVTAQVPTSDSGPFRVSLSSVHHHRDLMLSQTPTMRPPLVVAPLPEQFKRKMEQQGPVPPPPVPVQRIANDQFYAQMQVMVEPRLMLNNSHELKLTEAVDDLGQSLLQPSAPGQAQRSSAYFGYSPGGMLQLPIYLKYPEQPGKVIKKLKGVLPVTVSARKPDPLVVPLKTESLDKPFRNADAQVTVHEVKTDAANQRSTVTLTLRLLGQPGDASAEGGLGPAFAVGPRMAQLGQNQIEIVDAKGNTLHGFTSTQTSTRAQADEIRFTVTLMPLPEAGVPTELRYYGLTRATADVPFEFTDIPMP